MKAVCLGEVCFPFGIGSATIGQATRVVTTPAGDLWSFDEGCHPKVPIACSEISKAVNKHRCGVCTVCIESQ
ncbi:hypothetical protein BDV59DRAFT_140329 [Aspergillus ambiguus]|uniref:uncharacterized protein n=1 Tax=Aspergillus ambiguus TaxID=176160 RepID=UPI003CCCF597